jgi:hypothetical protein
MATDSEQEGTTRPVTTSGGDYIPLDRRSIGRGIALAVWIVVLDVVLKLLAHVGGCSESGVFDLDVFDRLWTAPPDCHKLELLGPFVTLIPRARNGLPFGLLDEQLVGFNAQVWGLSLLALAAIVTILVWRWRWQDSGDGLALGALWGGVLVHGAPRAAGSGVTFTEINLLDFGVGIGDVAVAWGVVWLLLRWIGELRA